MTNLNRKICCQCRRIFVPENNEQTFCSFICDCHYNKINAPGSKGRNLKCRQCGKSFYHWNLRYFCSDICNKDAGKVRHKTEREKIETQNKLWLENNSASERLKRHNKNKIPFDVLNKMEEYKRVYGKNAWKHYIKGRKWDRI